MSESSIQRHKLTCHKIRIFIDIQLLSNNEEKIAIEQEVNERKSEYTKAAETTTTTVADITNTDYDFLILRREHLDYSS
jgi:beta-galactosidase beta subunit